MTGLKDIRKLDETTLLQLMEEWKVPAYRARILHKWLRQKSALSFDEMTDLPLSFRERLKEEYGIFPVRTDAIQKSTDGTFKLRFILHDGHKVEGVLIPAGERMTACISTQVGCSLTCSFCATGRLKRLRNLDASEIVDQVVLLNNLSEEKYDLPLSNIVYMGMGEPLLNYNNVKLSVHYLTDEKALNIAARRITVSTAGIAKMIRKLADDGARYNLALSLHAATDEKRNEIMPINEQNNLEALKEALRYYYEKCGNTIFFEYIAFKNFNDGLDDARDLAKFCASVPCKVNIIEYNSIGVDGLVKSDEDRLVAFQRALLKKGITATYRRSRGKDIDAACGQLANKE